MLDVDVINPFILWPIGVALGGFLFFEIAKHCWRVDSVPRAFEARSKAIGPEWPAADAPRPARAAWPSQPAEAQRILAGSEPVWSIPSGNINPTRCEARVMVSIRVIGEDDAVALVQIAGAGKRPVLYCRDFKLGARHSTLQAQVDLGHPDVPVRIVPCGCDASIRYRRS
jgi:hypothetical protein